MLIVEGPDNVGKTTLCKRLIKELDLRGWPAVYRHFTKLPVSWDYCHDYIAHIEPTAVMDRFWLSEPIYAQVRREKTPLTEFKMEIVKAHLTLAGAFTVVVNASPEVVSREYAQREQMYTLESALETVKLYEKQRHMVPDMTYTVTMCDGPTYPSSCDNFVISVVENYLKRQTELAQLMGSKRWPHRREW